MGAGAPTGSRYPTFIRYRPPQPGHRYSCGDTGVSSSAQVGQGIAKIGDAVLDIGNPLPSARGVADAPTCHPSGGCARSRARDRHTERVVSPVHLRAEHVPPVGGSSQLILIDGRTFAIGDQRGDIGGGAEGYVHADRRHLSRFDVLVDGARLSSLAVATPSPSSSVVVHRLRDELGVERPAIVVRRRRLGGTLHEDVELWATGREPITVSLVGRRRGGLRAPLRRQGRPRPARGHADGRRRRVRVPATPTARRRRRCGGTGRPTSSTATPGTCAGPSRRRLVNARQCRSSSRPARRSPADDERSSSAAGDPLRRPPPSGLGQSGAERHLDGRTVVRGRRIRPSPTSPRSASPTPTIPTASSSQPARRGT